MCHRGDSLVFSLFGRPKLQKRIHHLCCLEVSLTNDVCVHWESPDSHPPFLSSLLDSGEGDRWLTSPGLSNCPTFLAATFSHCDSTLASWWLGTNAALLHQLRFRAAPPEGGQVNRAASIGSMFPLTTFSFSSQLQMFYVREKREVQISPARAEFIEIKTCQRWVGERSEPRSDGGYLEERRLQLVGGGWQHLEILLDLEGLEM